MTTNSSHHLFGRLIRSGMLCLLIVGLSSPALADSRILTGADGVQLQAWVDQVSADKLRPIWIHACVVQKTPQFAAIAEDGSPGVRWAMRHNLTPEEFQPVFDEYAQDGYQLLSWTVYQLDNKRQLAAIWMKNNAGSQWLAQSQLTTVDYRKTLKDAEKQGLSPWLVTPYLTGQGDRLAAIFRAEPGLESEMRLDLTLTDLEKLQRERTEKHFRPESLTILKNSRGTRAHVRFVRDGYSGEVRLGLSDDDVQNLSSSAKDFKPISITGYLDQGRVKYGVALRQREFSQPHPTGDLPPRFEAMDRIVREFMQAEQITSGTLSVGFRGQVLVSRGYGFSKYDHVRQVQPNDPLRIASISKPITAALVRHLARAGKVSLDAKAFELIGAKPLPEQKVDPRIEQITVEHLLGHQGGWMRGKTYDPMFRALQITEELKRPAPATPHDVIQYMLGQPLQFDPGAHEGKSSERYSNFGYCVLGRVVEKVTGQTYYEALNTELLQPLNIAEITLGRTRPADRHPNEPHYRDAGIARSVFVADRKEWVYWPDGGFCLESMDSHGGLIASAPALVQFFQNYWVSGEPRRVNDAPQEWAFTGSLDGTAALLRQTQGVDYAVLLNHRISNEKNRELQVKLDVEVGKIDWSE